MNYDIIYADPPWSYNDKSLHRGGAERHYNTMSFEEMRQLNVSSIAAENSILFMWATFPKIEEALELIKSWGFRYKTCAFVWVKANKRVNTSQLKAFPCKSLDDFMGMGRWTRSNAEICLLAIKGKPKRINGGIRQVIYTPISEHSKKPTEARTRIVELCGNLSKIELFSRQKIDGWDNWGNEIDTKVNLSLLESNNIPHINNSYLNKSNIYPVKSVEDKDYSIDVIIIDEISNLMNIGYYNYKKKNWLFHLDFEIPKKFKWFYKPNFHK